MKKTIGILIILLLFAVGSVNAATLTHNATGDSDIAETITPSSAFAIESISLHLSAAGGGNDLTVSIDADAGEAYDTVLLTEDMTSVTDLVWQPSRPIEYASGDKIVVTWTNGSSRTYGLTVKWRSR